MLVVELKQRPSGHSEDGAELRVEKKTDVFYRLFLYLISPLLTNVVFFFKYKTVTSERGYDRAHVQYDVVGRT